MTLRAKRDGNVSGQRSNIGALATGNLETGMVFALETYCPATDGFSAARIEEEVVVTDTGCEVISLFPAEELPIANRY